MFQIFKEHKGFLGQIVRLAKNELIKTYKGSVIGPLWSVVKPSFTLFVYWFAFSLGFRKAGDVEVFINGDTVVFGRFLFILVGFVPWFFMQESIIHGMKSIRINRHFVTKVSFPVSTIMTYTAVARLYVHLFLTAIMYVIVAFTNGVGVSIYNLYRISAYVGRLNDGSVCHLNTTLDVDLLSVVETYGQCAVCCRIG